MPYFISPFKKTTKFYLSIVYLLCSLLQYDTWRPVCYFVSFLFYFVRLILCLKILRDFCKYHFLNFTSMYCFIMIFEQYIAQVIMSISSLFSRLVKDLSNGIIAVNIKIKQSKVRNRWKQKKQYQHIVSVVQFLIYS